MKIIMSGWAREELRFDFAQERFLALSLPYYYLFLYKSIIKWSHYKVRIPY